MILRHYTKLFLFAAAIVVCLGAAVRAASAERPVMLGPILLGYDLDLPENPTIEQQVKAGKRQLEILREQNETIDSQSDAVEYFNELGGRLLKSHEPAPPFAIVIHVSTVPVTNAEAMPGGQIVVFSHIFDLVDDEAELVGIIAHEISHQLNGDFLKFWHDYKQDKPVFGKSGVLEESQAIEAAADAAGVRLMYDAGWNPQKMVKSLEQLEALGVRARHGAPTMRSTHPRGSERMSALEALIAGFPPKQGLIDDSQRFQELKQQL